MAAFDEKEYTKSFDWSIWRRLAPFVRPFRRDFVGMLVFNGLCALVDVAIRSSATPSGTLSRRTPSGASFPSPWCICW